MINQSLWLLGLCARRFAQVFADRDRGTLDTGSQGAAGSIGVTSDASDVTSDVNGISSGPRRGIGPIGSAARLAVGFLLAGSVVFGQLESHHPRPATWALGLLGFPALMLAWHYWRVRRNPARFYDTSPLNFLLGILLFLVLYFTWWYAPALSVTSDAALLYFGGSMLLAALRGDAGCEILALSNWLLRRHDQIACAAFAPIDALERRWARP